MKVFRNIFFVAVPALGVLTGAAIHELPANPVPTGDGGKAVVSVSRTLHGDVLLQSDALALPMALAVAGDRLILADDYADRHVRVIRRSDGTIERSFGTTGRGPREFENIFSIDVINPSGELLFHDPTLQRITRVDLNGDFHGDRWVSDRTYKLNANATLLATMWSPKGLVGVGSMEGGRLAHLSPEGRLLSVSGGTPVRPSEARRAVWHRAMQTRLKPRPDRERWAVVSRFADRVEIYDADGALTALGDRLYRFDPQDLVQEDPEAVRFGYIDVATTESRIYALFSGRTRGEGEANYGDRIHVFDWDGHLLDVWQLDSRLISLAVTPDSEELYGVRHAPMPAVVHYSLN